MGNDIFDHANAELTISCCEVGTDRLHVHINGMNAVWFAMNTAHPGTRITVAPSRDQIIALRDTLTRLLNAG